MQIARRCLLCPISCPSFIFALELRRLVITVTTISFTQNFLAVSLIIEAFPRSMLLNPKSKRIVVCLVALAKTFIAIKSGLSAMLRVLHRNLVTQLVLITSCNGNIHLGFHEGLPFSASLDLINRILQDGAVIENLTAARLERYHLLVQISLSEDMTIRISSSARAPSIILAWTFDRGSPISHRSVIVHYSDFYFDLLTLIKE
jgi:hypothetical protein